MARQTISVRAESPAPPPQVFEVVRNRAMWPEFSRLDSFQLERPGNDGGHGVGSIGVLRRGPLTAREEIVELFPNRRMSYILVSGLPLREYRAVVDLCPAGSGTAIQWTASFRPAIPGTGALLRLVLRRAISEMARGMADHAATLDRTSTAGTDAASARAVEEAAR